MQSIRVRLRTGGTMSRYLRMMMLLLAAFFFMIPLLGRPLVARSLPEEGITRMHGPHGMHATAHVHQSIEADDDPLGPCTEE